MSDWRKEFQYLLDRKILSRAELGYLFGQIKSIIDNETKSLQNSALYAENKALKATIKDKITDAANALCKSQTERMIALQLELDKLRWIPVSERLPKNVRTMQVLLKAEAVKKLCQGLGFYGEGENGFGWEISSGGLLTEVTHWKEKDELLW